MAGRLLALLAAVAPTLAFAAQAANQTILVTGATGRTGALLYKALQHKGVQVRALVRDTEKARSVLGCTKCDASEGIFVGDITKQETLGAAMHGVTALGITTSAVPHCSDPSNSSSCHFPKGGTPKEVDFLGGKTQIAAFGAATHGKGGPVVLCSSMGTTQPDNSPSGSMLFYKLNFEADLASSGFPFTVVKPCGLTDSPGSRRQLVVSHDDEVWLSPPLVPREDVARVMAEALVRPDVAAGLRFDLCSRKGPATTDLEKLFTDARWPWERPTTGAAAIVI